MDILTSIAAIASSGMRAQSKRLRVVSENVANADSVAKSAGGDPYRRKSISFASTIDPETGAAMVHVSEIAREAGNFEVRYDPSSPAADKSGFVKLPNVNPLIEMSNMREAARSYEANLSMLEKAQQMRQQLINLLK